MINMISGFRPSETIFEVGQRGTRKINVATSIMRQRRETVGKFIDAYKTKEAEAHAAEDADVQKSKQEAKAKKENNDLLDLGDDVNEDELLKTFNVPKDTTKSSKQKGK